MAALTWRERIAYDWQVPQYPFDLGASIDTLVKVLGGLACLESFGLRPNDAVFLVRELRISRHGGYFQTDGPPTALPDEQAYELLERLAVKFMEAAELAQRQTNR